MTIKNTVYGLVIIFIVGSVFFLNTVNKKTDFTQQNESKINSAKIENESQNKVTKALMAYDIKPVPKDYIPPQSLDKKVLDMIEDTKRNKEELLKLDRFINEEVKFTLENKKTIKNENNKIKYKSDDGSLNLTIAYSDKEKNQIRFIAYEDLKQNLKYISSKNYFGSEKDIFKERIIGFKLKDNLKLGNPDISIIYKNGVFEKFFITPNEDLDDFYIYDIFKDIIQIPRFDKSTERYIYYSYDYKGNLIE